MKWRDYYIDKERVVLVYILAVVVDGDMGHDADIMVGENRTEYFKKIRRASIRRAYVDKRAATAHILYVAAGTASSRRAAEKHGRN